MRGGILLKTPSIGGTWPYLRRGAVTMRFRKTPERHRRISSGDRTKLRLGSKGTLRVRNQTRARDETLAMDRILNRFSLVWFSLVCTWWSPASVSPWPGCPTMPGKSSANTGGSQTEQGPESCWRPSKYQLHSSMIKVVLYQLKMSDWPFLRELRKLKQKIEEKVY